MKRCVCILGNAGETQVTILKDNSILADFYGLYELDTFFLNTGIDRLDVIFKPTVTSSVPNNGSLISYVETGNLKKSLVISEDDVTALNDFSAAYKIGQVRVHSFLDVVVDRFKTYDKVIVLFDWLPGLTGVAYIELGQLKDFRKSRRVNLSADLAKFRQIYTAEVVSFDKVYDYASMKTHIDNLDLVPKEMLNQIAHIPYILNASGKIITDNSSTSYNLASSIGDSVNEIKEILVPSTLPTDDVDDDFSLDTTPKEPKTGGWFASLFRKKNKDDIQVKQANKKLTEDEIFSQLADGEIDEFQLRASRGGTISVTRKGGLQYIVIAVFMLVTFVAVTLTALNAIYVSQDSLVSGEYDSLIKVKNKIETSVELNEDPTQSPAMKVAQINSLKLPDGYSVKTINYENSQYSIMISIDNESNVDTIENYLPNGVKVGKINELVGDQYSSDSSKMYEIILLIA